VLKKLARKRIDVSDRTDLLLEEGVDIEAFEDPATAN
jgi:3-phenylpropionate/trans-cinnamate dioxygenase ferredoxin reductase subunit